MSLEEALAIIKQACASVMGNLEVHQRIQKAVEIIEKAVLDEK